MDELFMNRALELAQCGLIVSPNPMVGAVITKNNQIIAEGYHQYFGGAHAEINAFKNLPPNTPLDDVTLYVSLEPCSHHGKTPPCADQIIKLGIPRVIIACLDPNPLVAGRGVQKLKDHGITVITGVLESKAKQLNEVFFNYMNNDMPFVFVKCAMTLDGKIATKHGESQWISSEESRQEVHYLRSRFTAIMVGVDTVIEDKPLLTSRIENGRDPIKIIVDTNLRTPLDLPILKQGKTIIATCNNDTSEHQSYKDLGVDIIVCKNKDNRVDLQNMLQQCHQLKIDGILVEGGTTLISSLLEQNLIDKLRIYIAPKIFGGSSYPIFAGKGIELLSEAYQLKNISVRQNSQDIIIEGYLKELQCLQD